MKFVFVGPISSPSYFQMLVKTARDAGVKNHVVFAGQVPLPELHQLYYLADVFVLHSLREGMPLAMLEAMATGRPIISSSIVPLKEHLPNELGIAIPPSDHEAWAVAIIELLKDQDLREKFGEQARLHAYRNYRWLSV